MGKNLRATSSYLCLDAVEASDPEHLAPPQLHLCVINLIHVLHLLQLLLRDLLLLRPVTRRLQKLQPARGNAGDELRRDHQTEMSIDQFLHLHVCLIVKEDFSFGILVGKKWFSLFTAIIY